jgi:hypothetical protein
LLIRFNQARYLQVLAWLEHYLQTARRTVTIPGNSQLSGNEIGNLRLPNSVLIVLSGRANSSVHRAGQLQTSGYRRFACAYQLN